MDDLNYLAGKQRLAGQNGLLVIASDKDSGNSLINAIVRSVNGGFRAFNAIKYRNGFFMALIIFYKKGNPAAGIYKHLFHGLPPFLLPV